MTVKAKINPDAALPSASATGTMAQWHQNRQKLRAAVPAKASWGAPQATPKFDWTYNSLEVRGLVFNFSFLRSDQFTHIRNEIYKYVGK